MAQTGVKICCGDCEGRDPGGKEVEGVVGCNLDGWCANGKQETTCRLSRKHGCQQKLEGMIL